MEPPPSFGRRITPETFLDWAKQDIRGSSPRSAVNALNNVKRALHARIDEVLWVTRVQYSNDWNSRPRLEDKVKALKRIGISTTATVKILTARRNRLEHDYLAPTLDEVRSDVETCEMWISASERYPRHRVTIGGLPCKNISIWESAKRNRKGVEVEFKSSKGVVLFFSDAKRLLVKIDAQGSRSEKRFDSFNWKQLIDEQKKYLNKASLVPRPFATRIFQAYEKWVQIGTPSSVKCSKPLSGCPPEKYRPPCTVTTYAILE